MCDNYQELKQEAINKFFDEVALLCPPSYSDSPIPGLFINEDEVISIYWSGEIFRQMGISGLFLPQDLVMIYGGMFLPWSEAFYDAR